MSTLTPREAYESAVAQLRTAASEADAKSGGATAEDQARLVALMAGVKDAKRSYEEAKATSERNDVTSFLSQLSDAPESAVKGIDDEERLDDGRPVNPNGKTFGQIFAESEQYKALMSKRDGSGNFGKNARISTEPVQTGIGAKNLITGASNSTGGAFVVNDRYGPVTDLLGRTPLRVLDLVTVLSTSSDTVEYVRQTGHNNNAAPVPEATTILAPADYSAGGDDLGQKPMSDLFFDLVSTPVKTIAHWIPLTRRAAADVGQMRGIVEEFLRWGLAEELDYQMLRGPGTGENFTGIMSLSGLNAVGSAGTDIDAVVDAIRFVEWTGRRSPNALVIHPNDWYSTGFLLAKDGDNRYLIGDPRADVRALRTLWGLQVVVTDVMTENTALVGDFSQAVLWQREGVQLYMTDSHQDFFTRNILVILAEMRAAFGVLDTDAFVKINAV